MSTYADFRDIPAARDDRYFDYAGSAPPFPEALRAQAEAAARLFGNPSAPHPAGRAAFAELARCRELFAALCGFDGRLVITSGATEANNLTIHGRMGGSPRSPILVAADAHASVWEACRRYCRRMETVPLRRDGTIALADVADRLGPDVALFCCSHVSNETGVIHDAGALAALCERRGVPCLLDGSQALGHVSVDLSAIACDFYTFSAHKFGGPRGIGGLLARAEPGAALFDGGRQQWGIRPGTENLPGLAGALEALRLSLSLLAEEEERLRALAVGLAARLASAGLGMKVNGDPALGLPGFVSVSFPGLNGQTLAADLALRGFSVTTGSACHADATEPPRAILALGRTPEEALGTLRISFGRLTTGEAAALLADAVVETVRRASEGTLRPLSPPSPSSSPTPVPDSPVAPPADLAALDGLSTALRNRLQTLIRRGDAYFILGGSDPRDANGCCPSDEVGDANRLAEAGILCRHLPDAHPDACASTVYAFAGEMAVPSGGGPVFTRNDELRWQVASRLARRPGGGPAAFARLILGVAVGVLVVLGLASAVWQAVGAGNGPSSSRAGVILSAVPAPASPDGTTVVFFQGPERCDACVTMLRLVRETVRTRFAAESADGRMAVAVVDLELPQNAAVRRVLDLPFSTVGLVRYEGGQPGEVRLLTREAWRLYRDEKAFCDMLAEAIQPGKGAP